MADHDPPIVSTSDQWCSWRDYVLGVDDGPEAIAGAEASTVRIVLLLLGGFRKRGSGTAPFWATESIIAKKARVSKRQVRRILTEFEGKLFIRDRPGRGSRYMYHLLLPESADEAVRSRAGSEQSADEAVRGVRRPRPQSADEAVRTTPTDRHQSARARDASPQGRRAPALNDEEPAAAIGPGGGRTRFATMTQLQELGMDDDDIPSLEDDALALLEELQTMNQNGAEP